MEQGVTEWLCRLTGAVARLDEDIILAQPRYQDPRSLSKYRAQMYSQNGEDGAIAEILHRIGYGQGYFVEIGVGNGSQNNTRFLLEGGWSGIWWEAGDKHCESIRAAFPIEISSSRLVLVEGFVTKENGDQDLILAGCPYEFDVLSIDIDMNTSHVWGALSMKPRMAVIEYNQNVPPSLSWEVEYVPDARWKGDNLFGASLKRLEQIGEELGYSLVGCDLTGINAYFVRNDLCTEDKFLPPFTAEHHYEPPRLHFLSTGRGHPAAKRP
jgi:hypothetical protein